MSRCSSRRARWIAWLALACLAPAAHAQSQADDAIESFLDSHQLNALLAEQLLLRMGETPAAERAPIATQLASLYVELIENATSMEERESWESKARALLSMAPEDASAALRLDLDRARYATAERVIERARIRIASPAELQSALNTLSELSPTFDRIATQAHQNVLSIRRQEESGRDVDPLLLAEALRNARRQRSLGYYLAGWSNAYLAEFGASPTRAQAAIRQFGWLLGADLNEPPDMDRVPDQSMQLDHVGRSAIGVAVSYAALGDAGRALDWLDFIERHPETSDSVRAQLPGRRVAILAKLNRWGALETYVEGLRDDRDGDALEPGLARLIAVLALEGTGEAERTRRRIAQGAIIDLVNRQEIAQLVDLGERYGAGQITDGGFIGAHVRGLIAYESAREAHRQESPDADAPAASAGVVQSYVRAAELLRDALLNRDSAAYPEPAAATTLLLGLSEFFASGDATARAQRAASILQQASTLFDDDSRSADALWMAYRAAQRADTGDSASDLARDISQAFIERFPGDERSGVLRVQLAAAGSLPAEDALAILLDTARESPAYETARRHAARILYEQFREAPADRRDWAALRYADVAESLLAIDRARAAAGDRHAAELTIVRARRLLDALLSVRSPDPDRALVAIDAMESALRVTQEGAPSTEELQFRELQIALAQGDSEAAATIAAAIRRSGDERYIAAADRAIFNHVADVWRSVKASDASNENLAVAARDVISRGARLLVDEEQRAGAAASAIMVSVRAVVAHAAYDLWRTTGDRQALDLSFRQHVMVLEDRPNDRDVLRRLAEVAEEVSDVETALQSWRTLSSGLDPNTGPWFEARIRLIALLVEVDPDRARVALQQHVALRPDYGPAPWRERFQELEARLTSIAASQGGGAP